MFKQFHSPFPAPAWAGEGSSNPFLMSGRPPQGQGRKGHGHHRHQHDKGSSDSNWGDPPRTRRGDIKFLLLGLLSERAQHGYELMNELEARRGGFRRPSPGSVYPTLQMLAEGGYLTSEEVEGKRVYTITEMGRQLLRDRKQQFPVEDAEEGSAQNQPTELIELRRTLTELNDAVIQVARSGHLEQANQVRDLLVQVKREVYKLLAEQ
jgi:DNA-binding PadR family transcriptional regulator